MILTTNQVAQRLGITARGVRALAQRHGIGTELTPRQRVYTEADVQRLAERVGKRGQHISRTPSNTDATSGNHQ